MSTPVLFIVTVLVSFLGMIPAGLINSAVMLKSIQKGIKPALILAAGAVTIESAHIFLAIVLVNFLLESSFLFNVFRIASIVLFLAIGIYFYSIRNKHHSETRSFKFKSPFVEGLAVSNLNFLAVPFWAIYATWLETNNWVSSAMDQWAVILVAAVLGSYGTLWVYAAGSKFMKEKFSWFQEKIHLILSGIFFFLALFTLVRLL